MQRARQGDWPVALNSVSMHLPDVLTNIELGKLDLASHSPRCLGIFLAEPRKRISDRPRQQITSWVVADGHQSQHESRQH